ncbi:MAG: hypothetical protein ACLQM8_06975 [Limisphaerales bacterium]
MTSIFMLLNAAKAISQILPPPAPPIADASKLKPVSNRTTPQAQAPSQSDRALLLYAGELSFEDNLRRLKEFCHIHSANQQLQRSLDPFLKPLLQHARTEFPVIKRALESSGGQPVSRNLLLTCLIVAEGSAWQKADLVWRIATSREEPIETRRLATRLTSQFAAEKSRPDELLSLLEDSDTDIIVLALKAAPVHMDERGYHVIKTSLLSSTDITDILALIVSGKRSQIA